MAKRIRERAALRRENADKRPSATAKFLRVSSKKARTVIDLVRGKQVDEALAVLTYTNKSASPLVEKVLKSAIANAENNMGLDRDNLYIAEISANDGPKLKRFRAGSRGMAKTYVHYTSHITVVLDQKAN